jgi:predicted PurR-regulated permease PerM
VSGRLPFPAKRSRLAWWLLAGVCGAVLALFLYSFVGTFALGLFVYYAARPLNRRLCARFSGGVAASLTMALLILPSLLLLGYVLVVGLREFAVVAGPNVTDALLARLTDGSGPLAELVRDPVGVLVRLERLDQLRAGVLATLRQFGVIVRGLVHLTLALAFAFFLFRDGDRVHEWFHAEVGGDRTAAHAYLRAVDRDLEAVYFGNLLTVIAVTAVAVTVYNGFNLFAPSPLSLPFPTLLALLTGLATFVPLVVGKLVYLPAAGYLVWEATRTDAVGYAPVVAFLVVTFLLLDLLPQSLLRPYVSGRTLHTGLVLFAYVLGTALFGWYGLFYGPLLAVVVVQFANVVLPELVRGEPVTPATAAALDIGSEPPGSEAVVGGDGAGNAESDSPERGA